MRQAVGIINPDRRRLCSESFGQCIMGWRRDDVIALLGTWPWLTFRAVAVPLQLCIFSLCCGLGYRWAKIDEKLLDIGQLVDYRLVYWLDLKLTCRITHRCAKNRYCWSSLQRRSGFKGLPRWGWQKATALTHLRESFHSRTGFWLI